MPCRVQISLDLHDIPDALHVADIAVQTGVDWLEAGTGLMVEQGMAVVRALRQAHPLHPIVCDFKVCDGGAYFGGLAAQAGANYFDVMAASHDATIERACERAHASGIRVIADTMFCADPVARARQVALLGVDMIGWHLGLDHRTAHPQLRAIDGLADIIAAVPIPVQVVGGLSVEDAVFAARMGAASVVIGGPLVPGDRGPALHALLSDIVQQVRAVATFSGTL